MNPIAESVLHPEIQRAMDDVVNAKHILAEVLSEVQSKCEHHIVSEVPWRSGAQPARRICNHCRLEEEGSHWSGGSTWMRHDFGPAELGNVDGRLVVSIGENKFYLMRVQ